jgi:membrane-bound lytic murein transglycosylase D
MIKKSAALLAVLLAAAGAWSDPVELPAPDKRPQRRVPFTLGSFSPVSHSPLPPASNSLLRPEDLERSLTRHYIDQYASAGGRAWFNAVMRRGGPYLAFIREEIARRNLPPELLYLPVIESGYLSQARSKSGAVGLWQFMMNSIAPFNMKVTDLVDERRDFQKSTVAALRKLEENYQALGSWPLALAAYNAGLGGIKRVVQRTTIRDYWLLCEKKELPSETIHYVPRLLAVAHILSQPRRFGVDLWPGTVEWTALPVGRQASLDRLAEEAGVDRELLRLGNMELLHGITPPDSAYRLKVPADVYPLVAEVLERKDLKLLNFYRYVVKYGDTLSALARHYQVSLNIISQHNPGILNRYLQIGETLIIPALADTAPYRGESSGEARSFGGSYVVKKGDTLWSLALSYDVDPQELALANGMELNQVLREGKALKVPIME